MNERKYLYSNLFDNGNYQKENKDNKKKIDEEN